MPAIWRNVDRVRAASVIAMTAVGTSETYLQQFPVLLLCLEDRCADRAVLHPQIWRVIEKRHPPT